MAIREQLKETMAAMQPDSIKLTRVEQYVRPDHKITFARPEDIYPTFSIEFGFNGGPVDTIVLLNVSGIAGGGPATQTLQVAETIKYLRTQTDQVPDFFYVGKPADLPIFVEGDLTGTPPDLIAEVKNEESIPLKYQAAEKAVTETLSKLVEKGKKEFVFLSNGYTGFAPFAVKEAMKKLDPTTNKLRAKVLIFDSSLPDSSNPSVTRDLGVGYPTDRFNPEAYRSDENTDIYFLLSNWVPANPELYPKRAPEGAMVIATSLPFSLDYVRKWSEIGKHSKQQVREEIKTMPDFPRNFGKLLQNPKIIFIPLFASGGYWDENNVNNWMTSEQYKDMLIGTRNLMHAADLLSRKTDRPVLLTGVKPFVDLARVYAGQDRIDRVYHITDQDQPSEYLPRGVYLMEMPAIKQKAYQYYIKAADIGLTRSTQTNTMGEAVVAEVPMMVISMPENGYMDSQFMDIYYQNLQGLAVSCRSSHLGWADIMGKLVTEPKRAVALSNRQLDLFKQVYGTLGSNFVTVTSHICGIPYWE